MGGFLDDGEASERAGQLPDARTETLPATSYLAMDYLHNIVDDGIFVNAKNGLHITKQRHQGLAFVNTSSATARGQVWSGFTKPRMKFVTQKNVQRLKKPRKKANSCKNKDSAQNDPDEDTKNLVYRLYPSNGQSGSTDQFSFPFKSPLDDSEALVRGLPEWAVSMLPPGLSNEAKQHFYSYVYHSPDRTYAYEVLRIASHDQPHDQDRYGRMMMDPLSLRCALNMGALYRTLLSGKRHTADFASYSADLCSLVNRIIDERDMGFNLDSMVLAIQAVASLAFLAIFLGEEDTYHVHMQGLSQLIEEVGGLEALPVVVCTFVRKTDIVGAQELASEPYYQLRRYHTPVTLALPPRVRMDLRQKVHEALSNCGISVEVVDVFASTSVMVNLIYVIGSSSSSPRIPADSLIEEAIFLIYDCLTTPTCIHPRKRSFGDQGGSACSQGAMSEDCNASSIHTDGSWLAPQTMSIDERPTIETTMRLAFLLYITMFCASPPFGRAHLLGLLQSYMRKLLKELRASAMDQAKDIDTKCDSFTTGGAVGSTCIDRKASLPAILWIAINAHYLAFISDCEQWHWGHGNRIDRKVAIELVREVVGPTKEDVDALTEKDLAVCLLFDFTAVRIRNPDIRQRIKEILRGSRHW